ncbi:hypothetical protein BD414DRAFT_499016 [Trametes punicea]|nr:hypothetical protein BD414DRAFT_499016 [Trametes punicea]
MANNVRDAHGTEYSSGERHSQKIRGAGEVLHGIGDNLRGRLMSAVDSSSQPSGTHPEVEKGRHEVERGMAKLTGDPGTGRGPASSSSTTLSTDMPTTAVPKPFANALGPTGAMMAGVNAGPTAAVAEAPYQPEYSAGDAGPEDIPPLQQGSNDRDFHPGGAGHGQQLPSTRQQGATPGPAPDHNTLSRDPQLLG